MAEIKYKVSELSDYPLDPADPVYKSGRFLIEASAGTGKTFTIAHLVRRLVEERNIPMSRLLVTTFSNAAAAELKERIVLVLNGALDVARNDGDITRQLRLRMAISTVDNALITTIHGFCFKMLKSFALETRTEPGIALASDDTAYKDVLLHDYLRRNYYAAGSPLTLKEEDIKGILRYTAAGGQEIRPGDKGELCQILQFVQDGLRAEKRRQNVITYDDMILLFSEALRHNRDLAKMVRARFSAVFVDEFQDTSFDQFSIFDNCFPQEERSVLFYMIGDPKQSIYRFRGADVNSYLLMKRTLAEGQIFSMQKNYRSSRFAIDAVNHLFAGNAAISHNAFLQDHIDFIHIDCGKPGVFKMFENGKLVEAGMRIKDYRPNSDMVDAYIYDDICQEIASLLSQERNVTITEEKEDKIIERPLRASDIAILVQKHDQAPQFIRRLAHYGISASACKSGRIFQTPEAEWLGGLLHAWLNLSAADVHFLMLSEFFGADCGKIAESGGAEWVKQLSRQAEIWEQNGLPAAFTAFLDSEFPGMEDTPRQHVLCGLNGERCMSNLQQLVELLHHKAETEKLSPAEICNYLKGRCDGADVGNIEIAGSDDNPEQLRLDRDAAAVQIVTMFACKGLEYPVVFVPFPAKTWGPHMLMRGAPVQLHNGAGDILSFEKADKAEALAEAFREQVRLLYVALTRGKMMTYVCTRTAEPPDGKKTNYLRSAHGVMVSAPDPEQSAEARLAEMSAQRKLRKPAEWFQRLFGYDGMEPQKKYDVFERFEPGFPGTLRREFLIAEELAAAEMPVLHDQWRAMSFSAYGYGGHSGGDSPADRGDAPGDEKNKKIPETEYFLSFPRGAAMGDFVHGILERLARKDLKNCDFTAFLPENRSALNKLEEALGFAVENNRLERKIQLPRLMDGLRRALCTPLPGLDVPLCRTGKCIPEMEFFLKGKSLDLSRILAVMKECGSEKVREVLKLSSGSEMTGVLNGLIDLIFVHENKYYIVDWKTNFLGPRFADYDAPGVRHVMAESGYILQYHLYTAALCFFLKQRLPAFDYDQFGGVYYLFVRGMGSGENGIWFDRPPEACTDELVKLFTGEGL